MSNLERGFVRLPPDSTGKKSGAAARLIIQFTGESAPNLFEVGQVVQGAASSASADVVGIYREGFAAGEGQLFLDLNSLNGTFTIGEALQVSAVTYATYKDATQAEEIYYQKDVIIDRDRPDRFLTIGRDNAARVEFKDGPPSLSTFGGLIVNEPRSIRQYVHSYDSLAPEFYDQTNGSGTITYVSDERAVILDTGDTTSGDYAIRTSHYYHPYQAGTMSRVLQTVVVGDNGKANVRRRWGLFDERDGLFWELDGSNLYACIRSSVSGSPVDTRVVQSDWNKDPLNGTINFNLDITKGNLYFIDYQWLGVGLVRFGLYEEDGSRTVCHTFKNPNSLPTPYMRQGTLPIRFECENLDTASSSSELKSICTVVQNVGTVKRQTKSFGMVSDKILNLTQASGEFPIFSARAKLTYNGLVNRSIALLDNIDVSNFGNTPVILRLRYGNALVGSGFVSFDSTSMVEIDQSATGMSYTGIQRWTNIVGPNNTIDDVLTSSNEIFQDDVGLLVFADGVTAPIATLTAEVLHPTATGSIVASMTWKELWS